MTDNLTDAQRALAEGDYSDPGRSDPDATNYGCEHCGEGFDTLVAKRAHDCPQKQANEAAEADTELRDGVVAPEIHEFGAHVTFDGGRHGMSPYWAVVSQFDEALAYQDSDEAFIEDVAGSDWKVQKANYWESGIAAEGEDFDVFNEYKIKLTDLSDPKGLRKLSIDFKASLPNAKGTDGDPIRSLPDDLPEGIRVRFDSSYVDPEDYIPILRAVARKMDIRPSYFDSEKVYRPWSRVFNAAAYVRIMRSISEQLIVSEGALLERLGRFGWQNRGRGMLKWDNEEIMGHNNAFADTPKIWSKLIGDREIGALLKSYHMKNPEKNPDGSTSHPKLELQFSNEFSPDEREYIPWEDPDGYDRHDLIGEIDETLVNCLHWAGINLSADDPAYVEDEYFAAEAEPRKLRIVDDPIDVVEDVEADLAAQRFHAADLTDSEEEVWRRVADGGKLHYEELADSANVGTSTVYRALQKAGPVIRNEQGEIAVEDEVMRERLSGLFQVIDRAAEWAGRELRDLASDASDIPQDSPFARWMQTYGVKLSDLDGMDAPVEGVPDEDWIELDVNLGQWSETEIKRILREGGLAARDTSRDLLERFANAVVYWRDEGGDRKHRLAAGRFSGLLRVGGQTIA
ncbi:DUF7845 domain-containing protein [Salinarchaeum laminariae]|uniref:DUF7845 domain-containing protein n=1 Tax=Salinarchaeum laminariae TaxID=869888 RepID=UPI0020C13637|nr:hypothetical protein [Salinarchaeum laminariae]